MLALMAFLEVLTGWIDDRYLSSWLIGCPFSLSRAFDHRFEATPTIRTHITGAGFSDRWPGGPKCYW